MNQINNDLDTKPWYKQGWPWALIAIPFVTVVTGVIKLIIANDTSDSLVADDYYKKGLAINSNLERIETAKKMNIVANISLDPESNLISLKLESNQALPKAISLLLSHPTQKEKDVSLLLSNLTGNDYVANLKEIESGYWHIIIEDIDKSWLVKSRWLYPDSLSLSIDANKN